MQEPPRSSPPQLIRALGRWSMVALAVNCILGSGIFGLPSLLAGLLGRASVLAVLIAALAMGVIIACYAEVATRFNATGGTYLYLRTAFGRLIGVQTGWLTLLVRITACAASTDLFADYLRELWPAAASGGTRLLVITAFIGLLLVINIRGVRAGALMSNLAVLGKLLALGILCVAAVVWFARHAPLTPPAVSAPVSGWRSALLLLFFLYGGYEAALYPLGEARDPRRDVVFALFTALGVVALLYAALQFVTISVLADPAASARPLADVARVLMGAPGGALVTVGALVSVYGYVSANMLASPRGMYALAEQGDFPPLFARVHARYHTPYVAIAVFAALVWLFARLGDFSWNVTLSAVARLLYYGAVCAAVPVLRRRAPAPAGFRVPGGLLLPVTGVVLCALLLSGVDFSKSLILLATIAVALLNWFTVSRRGAALPRA
jgi:basic amino acid/polyamine antiporter, APA family